jgi:hypothetical protein
LDGLVGWLTVGTPDQPDIEIILEPMTFASDAEDERVLRSFMELHVIQGLIFVVDERDETFERVKTAGATVGQESTNQP